MKTQPEKPSVFIETFGCQMNILDSELVRNQLTRLGYPFVQSAHEAGVVLFNTCSVRALSEQKVLSRLGIIRQRKLAGEKLVVGVLGCMAERLGKDLLGTAPYIDLLVGPNQLHEVPQLLENRLTHLESAQNLIALSDFRERKGKSSALPAMDDLEALDAGRYLMQRPLLSSQSYVRITRGCNKFCSFCVVPRTRGPEIHRHPDGIIEEIKRLVEQGVREVTLLGQTINHYAYTSTQGRLTPFSELLFRIHEEVQDLPRLRFLTSYPRDFTDATLDVMASCERICKYLHIPAQSGSDPVLKRMNRGYTREIYLSLIERARAKMPTLSILGDMIVGFPGETQEDFALSLSLLKEVQYKGIFVFKYSPRPGTTAYKNYPDDIPDSIKRERNQKMLHLQREISLSHHQAMQGKIFEVLVEGPAKLDPLRPVENPSDFTTPKAPSSLKTTRLAARTRGDHLVVFDGPSSLIGHIVPLKITNATALSLTGEKV